MFESCLKLSLSLPSLSFLSLLLTGCGTQASKAIILSFHFFIYQISGSESVVPRPTAGSSGNLSEMQILGPHMDMLNQKLGSVGLSICV